MPPQFLPPFLLLMSPLVYYLANLFNRNSQKITTIFLAFCCIGSFLVLFLHCNNFLPDTTFLGQASARILVIDSTSRLMISLISFISLVTFKYAAVYLDGRLQKQAFLQRMTMLTAVLSLLVVCNDVRLLVALSIGISLLLTNLVGLTQSSQAHSASKTIMRNLLTADLILATVAIMLSIQQNCDIAALSAVLLQLDPSQQLGWEMALISLLLAVFALMKSAVFPFHGWLCGSLEAPTPLSAFLHAGVVNIAGFLAIKFSPLLCAPSAGGYMMVTFGLASAFMAAMISITRPDVKGKLVFSTVAQMGFMCLQCGIGALHAALFHLVFHGCFKCYLFLNSASAIIRSKELAHPVGHHLSERFSAVSAIVAVTLLILALTVPSNALPLSILAISMLFELSVLPDNPLKEKLPIGALLSCIALPACLLLVGYAMGSAFFASYVVNIGEHRLTAPIMALVSSLMLTLWILLRVEWNNSARIKDWLYVWANNRGYISR